jgi:hypothetical protein
MVNIGTIGMTVGFIICKLFLRATPTYIYIGAMENDAPTVNSKDPVKFNMMSTRCPDLINNFSAATAEHWVLK